RARAPTLRVITMLGRPPRRLLRDRCGLRGRDTALSRLSECRPRDFRLAHRLVPPTNRISLRDARRRDLTAPAKGTRTRGGAGQPDRSTAVLERGAVAEILGAAEQHPDPSRHRRF